MEWKSKKKEKLKKGKNKKRQKKEISNKFVRTKMRPKGGCLKKLS